MRKIYMAPELEIENFKLKDLVLASTESGIDEQIGGGGGGSSEPSPFDDIP